MKHGVFSIITENMHIIFHLSTRMFNCNNWISKEILKHTYLIVNSLTFDITSSLQGFFSQEWP